MPTLTEILKELQNNHENSNTQRNTEKEEKPLTKGCIEPEGKNNEPYE